MFIEQAFKGRHEWWRYLVGTFIIVVFFLLGQLPISIALLLKATSKPVEGIKNSTKALMEAADLSPNMFTFLLLLTFVFGFAGIYIVVRYLHKQSMTNLTTSRKKIDWKRILFCFSLVALYIIISTLLDYKSNPEDYSFNFKLVPFLILLVISIILVPIQTSFEEYFFRGYLMQGLGLLAKNRWFPLLLTSILFGILHFSNPEVAQFGPMIMFYYIGTGLFLGVLTLMDDGMELSLGFHAANNLIQILLVTADWSAFQSESVLKDLTNPTNVGAEILIPLLIFYPIMILIFAKIYRWKNWKQKLFGKISIPPNLDS